MQKNRNKTLVVAAGALLCTFVGGCAGRPPAGAGAEPAVPQLTVASGAVREKCAELLDFSHTSLRMLSAETIPHGKQVSIDGVAYQLPEHCYVRGRMNERTSPVDGQGYAIRFEMSLPKDWNGRLFFQPNGGVEGSLAVPMVQAYGRTLGGSPVDTALQRGFAVVTTDSGHDGSANTSVAPAIRQQVFGIDPQARTENAHGYVAVVTPMAKKLIAAAYGKAPDRSYMVGTSNGGRVGMVTAARYPALFDGIVSGPPAFNLPKAVLAAIWNAQAMAAIAPLVDGKADISRSFSQADMDLVANRVLERCDALDGLDDGLVFDIQACRQAFSLKDDVPTCSSALETNCLTAAKKNTLDKMMQGPKDRHGNALYAEWPFDPGMRALGWRQWQMGDFANAQGPASASNPTSRIMTLTGPGMAFMFSNPPQSPDVLTGQGTTIFDYVMGFRMNGEGADALKIFATGNGYAEAPYDEYTPPHPDDLAAFRQRGAKMIVYHGTADPVFSVNDTIRWYEALAKNHRNRAEFVRLFVVPGMLHSYGGPAADKFDMVTAIVDWVEKGIAPQRIVASTRPVRENSETNPTWPEGRTRPLCPYPQIARYLGEGSIETETSFVCL
ncbi:tannase/feruloyl esterase family alpha/beta hydrolase [Propionivibrio limicola]|uniref:tannase/feruloyl esterase family alpha/beta hydrolase n=1 Tax=Propionivibrio limicola TaxID=167645 RepID=UPI0012926C6B|nr:tannase/feruloyl esterase family alpha/beta hydrolase [Propionivibrio limicola]